MTAIIILAAGGSNRLGRPKQLLSFQGESFLRRSARFAVEAGCGPVIVVLGYSAQEMVSELSSFPVRAVINPGWKEGIASSLGKGLQAVPEEATAVLLMLCDQPYVDAEVLRRLVAVFEGGAPIVACRYRNVLGVPALFSREFFDDLRRLKGDEGARSVIQTNLHRVEVVDCEEAGVDIDTEAEYSRLNQDP